MALTVSNLGPGNYVLGGLGAVQGPSAAEAMDLAQREEQRFRDAQRAARETEQRMALVQSQEARAQATFQAQQRARAQAAAQATQSRAAMDALMAGLTAPAAAPPGVGAIAPVAPPRTGLEIPQRTGPALSFGTPTTEVSEAPFAGLRNVEFVQGAMPAGAPPSGIPMLPDGSPDWAAFEQQLGTAGGAVPTQPGLAVPGTMQYGPAPLDVDRITEVDPTASAAMQDLQALSRRVDINNAATRIGNSVLERTSGVADYLLRTPEEGAQRAEARARGERVRNWFTSNEAQAIFQADPTLLQDAARDPLGFYQQYSGEAPATAEEAAPATAEEAAPTQDTPWGGLQLSFGTPVQLSFGEFDGRGSEAYVAAPERIFQDAELAARQQQRLQLLAGYYQQTGNLQGLVGVLNQLDELTIEQRYLDGMTAIVGIQQENFGPVQALLQQRYPGQQVEVRPYTDGTVEVFLDGQSEARLTWDDLAMGLRGSYDRGFIEQQNALATEAAERSRLWFEQGVTQEAQAMREIAVYQSRQELDRALAEGELIQVSTEPPVYNMLVNGRYVPVTVDAIQEGKGPDAIVRYVVRPIGTGAVE